MNFITGTIKGNEITFDKNDNRFDVSKTGYELSDKAVYFGFRPENISMHPVENAYKIHALATLTEMLGDSTNIYIEIGGDTVILKVDPHDAPKMDEEFDFYLPYEKVYLFDKESEFVFKKK